MTTALLWLLVGGHLLFWLAYDRLLTKRFGPTLLRVRLRRRWVDGLFFALILGAALASCVQSGRWDWALPLALLLLLLPSWRPTYWQLKTDGFILAGRYWPYSTLQQIQLADDGVLHLTLNNGVQLPLAAVNLDELEAAAYFLGSGELPPPEQKP